MKNLASRIRPTSVSEIVGQTHLTKADGIIKKMIEKNYVFSTIFYGPPGTGKSTFAQCLAKDLKIPHITFNATIDNKDKLNRILEEAKMHERFIVILEEIHRFNKDKQDILLPLLETNKIFIFASTTENPYFCINPAVRSRCQILELKSVSPEELTTGLKTMIAKHELKIDISDELLHKIALHCNGDIRSALNVIDLLINLYGDQTITTEILLDVIQNPVILGSHYGDELHNLKSAFHKSLRGSDVDASLHYLARLIKIQALDDISRRMLACVYEDIGLANPNLCLRVSQGIESSYRLGFPECIYVLGNLTIQIALSPKSNSSSTAVFAALADLDSGKEFPIPKHLWDSHYASSSKLGVVGYKYPHDYENNYITQQYLPTSLKSKKYYEINLSADTEVKLNEWLKKVKKHG